MWRSFFRAGVAYCTNLPDYPSSAHDIWQLDEEESLRYSSSESKQQHLAFRAFLRQKFATVGVVPEERPRVFISYPWAVRNLPSYAADKKNELMVEQIAFDLEAAQFQVHLDKWEDRLQSGILEFMKNMPESDHLMILGTPLYLQKYNREVDGEDENEHVVRFEADVIADLSMRNHLTKERVIPIVLTGSVSRSIPPLLQSKAKLHLTEGSDYHEKMLHLICDLRGLNYQERCQLEMAMRSYISQAAAETKDDGDLSLALEDRPRARRTLPRRSQTKAPPAPGVSHNLPRRNPYFTGRDELFLAIKRALSTNEGMGVIAAQAVSGMGGIGKSSLASEYAYRSLMSNNPPYYCVRWMVMEDKESSLAAWLQLANDLGIDPRNISEDELIASIYRHLGDGPFLFIFDNVKDCTSIQKYLPPRPQANQHILITSRNRDDWHNPIYIDLFTDREASDYASKFFPTTSNRTGVEDDGFSQLNRALSGLPLALTLALAYMREHHLTAHAYLHRLKQKGLLVLSCPAKSFQHLDTSRAIESVWQLTMENLRSNRPRSLRILTFCSLLAPDNIPLPVLAKCCQLSMEDLEEELASLSCDSLITTSFLGGPESSDRVSIHRLLQDVVSTTELAIDRLTEPMSLANCDHANLMEQWLAPLVTSLLEAFPHQPKTQADFNLLADLSEHYHDVLTLLEMLGTGPLTQLQAQKLNEWKYELKRHLGQGYREQCRYEESLKCKTEALELSKVLYGELHSNVATVHRELGQLYNDQGRYWDALRHFNEALDIEQNLTPISYENLATILRRLGQAYRHTGQYKDALSCHREALKIWRAESPNKLEEGIALHNIGQVYRNQGNYDLALDNLTQALNLKTEIFKDQKNPSTGVTLRELGTVYDRLGRYTEAITKFEASLVELRAAYGEEHPRIATTLHCMGLTYWHMRDYERALEHYQEGLKLRRKFHGETHPDVAASLHRVGQVYITLRETEKGLEHYEKALAIQEEVYHGAHPKIARTLTHIAMIHLQEGDIFNAGPLLERAQHIMANYPENDPTKCEVSDAVTSLETSTRAESPNPSP